MFTLTQIAEAHSVVKSGADFPKLVLALKKLGVTKIITWVHDGHSQYFDESNNELESDCLYPKMAIANIVNAPTFLNKLKEHQQGATDYFTFCIDAANNGIAYWEILTDAFTCTYKDIENNSILEEKIPQVQ
jgi:uncharacterized protein YbcV (DUF1398 family)